VLKSLDYRESDLPSRGEVSKCTSRNAVFAENSTTRPDSDSPQVKLIACTAASEAERLGSVNAVKCLQTLPARTPASVASGAKSRFDDFVVTQMTIHYTGKFQPWHRRFVHLYEKAPREECGYKGYQPVRVSDFVRSSIRWPTLHSTGTGPSTRPRRKSLPSSAEISVGGNGEFVPHSDPVIIFFSNPTLGSFDFSPKGSLLWSRSVRTAASTTQSGGDMPQESSRGSFAEAGSAAEIRVVISSLPPAIRHSMCTTELDRMWTLCSQPLTKMTISGKHLIPRLDTTD
ncbi:Uncharacterized protein TPAR_08826, partial [Tolypocladium paradoxum]